MTDAGWLKALQAGDMVAIARSFQRGYAVFPVVRATATVLDCGQHGTFRRSDGYQRGRSGYHHAQLQPVSAEVLEANLRERLVYRLGEQQWSELPLDVLKSVAALLPEMKK